MTDNQALILTGIFLSISDLYDSELFQYCQRFSNNNSPEFSDTELITIYLYAMTQEQRFTIRQIYDFSSRYLHSWFPKLPSYVAFNKRLNKLSSVFQRIAEIWVRTKMPQNCNSSFSLLDSMPIITCSAKRSPKVATEMIDKGYCSAKNLYYFGLKLHLLAFQNPGSIPFPESLVFSPASENDLNVFKQYWSDIRNRTFWGDKIYHDTTYFENLYKTNNSIMRTPVKAIKGQAENLKQIDKASNDLFSTAVSKIRQPIESFFNWLIQKTDIQSASKVRSSNGLLIHIFGRIAAALFCFNS